MNTLTRPIIGLHFIRQNSVVIDTTHGLIHFPHLTMQVKSASKRMSAKPQVVFIHHNLTVPPMTTKTTTAIVDHSSVLNTKGTVIPVKTFPKAASLITPHSNSTIIDKTVAVRVSNTMKSGITSFNQQKHTNCQTLRSHSGASHVQ